MSSAETETPPPGVTEPPRRECVELEVERWDRGKITRERDLIAEEMPIALIYHGVPHVAMLATPADLEDYAVGFTLSEGLVERPDEIRGVEVVWGEESAEVRITVAWERFSALLDRRRNLTGRTGCGLCGQETVEEAVRDVKPVGPGARLSVAALHEAIAKLAHQQPINARTGSVHAAAWVAPGKGIQVVREDVLAEAAIEQHDGVECH